MRRLLLSTLALASTALTALAGDLPSEKAPPAYIAPIPAFSWTGVYVGVEGGVDFITPSVYDGFNTYNNDITGGLFGGVVGYNYEFPNNFLLGLEGDAGGVFGARRTIVTVAAPNYYNDSSYFADIRARAGYAIGRSLLYAAGGVAFGDVQTAFVDGASFTAGRVGYTIGGGLEYAFTDNLIGRAEYRHSDLGSQWVGGNTFRTTYQTDAVLAGLLYKFGPAPVPVVAKY